ncbi:MAG: hypothetical protein ABR572_09715 [Cryomorphaceae bacterium]|nr:hypothetical protein [Flavobacteriales bacterium]
MNANLKSDPSARTKYAEVNKCRSRKTNSEQPEDFHIAHSLVQRNWFEVREKLLDRFPVLNPEDVEFAPGKKQEMMRAIEEKLGMSPAKLQRVIGTL